MTFINVDLRAVATNPYYFPSLLATNVSEPAISFLSFDRVFQQKIFGPQVRAHKIADLPWEAFHEAGIYNKEKHSMYITSNFNQRTPEDNINITIVSLDDYSITSTQFPNLWEANGGSSWYPPGSDTNKPATYQVYCDEGDLEHYSSLVSVNPITNESTIILNNYLGRNFSSINDVRQHPHTGDLWFTDAAYGYFQFFRPVSTIPQMVYRFAPGTGELVVVADGFDQPNGLEFSPDYKTLYVSDTGARHYDSNSTRPATIYAFDIDDAKRLSNRRTFAYIDKGFPDGIHTDTAGNVWAACGDGVHVFDPAGKLLGKVFIGETSNNFAFLPNGLLVFSNSRLWLVDGLNVLGREVCKDFGKGCGK
ncbi:lactonohydrolase [Pseudovirgaria hyperparasitica]|uniref:Lactonohydrolase n=1 Tax=Pseudovirgaria hyperparasitica TaxID=470096 RepID=A0A6A6WC13_9PEZI|nr:lactonohydrolase [Pseudovirgaria hyperparasitica]KAF2758651.1 lactonohydrolase [Pseudovirgaria hyperparasitica]